MLCRLVDRKLVKESGAETVLDGVASKTVTKDELRDALARVERIEEALVQKPFDKSLIADRTAILLTINGTPPELYDERPIDRLRAAA